MLGFALVHRCVMYVPINPVVRDWFDVVPVVPGRNSGLVWKAKPHGKVSVGSDAGWMLKRKGGTRLDWAVKVRPNTYIVARVVYFLHHGVDPGDLTVDHIDRNSLNNNIDNLRLLNKSQQNCNTKRRVNNTSGCRGVSWHDVADKWIVQLWISKKKVYLGCYSCKLKAASVYNEACRRFYPDVCQSMLNGLTEVKCACSSCSC